MSKFVGVVSLLQKAEKAGKTKGTFVCSLLQAGQYALRAGSIMFSAIFVVGCFPTFFSKVAQFGSHVGVVGHFLSLLCD